MRLALIAFLAACILGASGAGATPPGTNGRIVFERLRLVSDTTWGELFVMNDDGSDVHRLTHPPRGTEDTNPDWSPDGSRIVFARAPARGAHSIWAIDADGTNLHRLTPPCPPGAGIPHCAADDGWPTWSPDGKHIAFQRLAGPLKPAGSTLDTAKRIYKDELIVTDPNGRHARTLVWFGPWRGDPQIPAWSPNGNRLVFLEKSDNGGNCVCRVLYIVNADGTGLHRLTPPSIAPGDKIDWSPDGTTILFRTHRADAAGISGVGAELYTIRPNGTGLHQLTHFPRSERVLPGSYSPDGRSIVFETSAGAVGGSPDVFVMNADGTRPHPLTRTPNFETQADWGTNH